MNQQADCNFTEDEAIAIGLLLKRLSLNDMREKADSIEQAYLMRSASFKMRASLEKAGIDVH